MNKYDLVGSWLLPTTIPVGYRVLPKCGCSTIAQTLYFMMYGHFFDGDVHLNKKAYPILDWDNEEHRPEMAALCTNLDVFWFSFVRNPFSRVFSAFADKIFGYQPNGKRFESGKYHRILHKRGMHWGPDSDIRKNFKLFVRLCADTVEQAKPVRADVHWIPCAKHLAFTKGRNPSINFKFIGHIETFNDDIRSLFLQCGADPNTLPNKIPRENSTSIPNIPSSDFFGDEEIDIICRVYAKDFEIFGYSTDPTHRMPIKSVSIDDMNQMLVMLFKNRP